MEWLNAFCCTFDIAMITTESNWHEIVDGVIGNASLLEVNRPLSKFRGRSRAKSIEWHTPLLQAPLA